MQTQLKRIVVTGCNKGVGYGIIENLIQKPGYEIIMACRNLKLAENSKQQLIQKFNIDAQRLQTIELDISNTQSIDKFIDEYKNRFQTADILINNAGMAFKGDEFGEHVVRITFATNYYGTIELSEKFLPLINNNGKVIIIGSSAGKLNKVKSQELLHQFQNPNITKDQLSALAKEFYNDVKADQYDQKWAKSAYGMSKLCINTYARVFSNFPEVIQKNIQVYTCCPGWVKTDMAGDKAPLTIQQGALTPIYLVELPYQIIPEFQGKFFYEQKIASL